MEGSLSPILGLQWWHIWLIVGMLLVVAEIAGGFFSFVLLALGVSCLTGVVMDFMGASLAQQVTGVAVTAFILTPLFVIMARRLHAKRKTYTDAGDLSRYEGRQAKVEHFAGKSVIYLNGDRFRAVLDSGEPAAEGTAVTVTAIKGLTAVVKPQDASNSGK